MCCEAIGASFNVLLTSTECESLSLLRAIFIGSLDTFSWKMFRENFQQELG